MNIVDKSKKLVEAIVATKEDEYNILIDKEGNLLKLLTPTGNINCRGRGGSYYGILSNAFELVEQKINLERKLGGKNCKVRLFIDPYEGEDLSKILNYVDEIWLNDKEKLWKS